MYYKPWKWLNCVYVRLMTNDIFSMTVCILWPMDITNFVNRCKYSHCDEHCNVVKLSPCVFGDNLMRLCILWFMVTKALVNVCKYVNIIHCIKWLNCVSACLMITLWYCDRWTLTDFVNTFEHVMNIVLCWTFPWNVKWNSSSRDYCI